MLFSTGLLKRNFFKVDIKNARRMDIIWMHLTDVVWTSFFANLQVFECMIRFLFLVVKTALYNITTAFGYNIR